MDSRRNAPVTPCHLHTVRSLLFFVAILSTLISIEGCYYDKEETLYPSTVSCATATYTYTTDVAPLLATYCATDGCHNASNAGNVTLLTYTQAKTHAARLKQRAVIDKTMPPGGGMTAAQLAVIKCWIENGTTE